MASFLYGVVTMACSGIGAFFFRFWRESNDRLFCWLGAAFVVFAVNYAALGVLPLADEHRVYAFALRLLGFVAILIGVLLKDRDLQEHLGGNDR
jgi:uncharacterized protein (TIGR04206 family)